MAQPQQQPQTPQVSAPSAVTGGNPFADALARFGALGRNARLYLISNAMQAVSAGALGVLYTLFLTALGFGGAFIGAVAVLGTVGGGLGIIPANPLTRRFGWRAMLIWSDLIGGVAIAAQIIAPSRVVILLTTVGIGVSVAIIFVINIPLLTAYSTPRERTALFGLNNALAVLFTVVGSLLGGFLPTWFEQPGVRASLALRTLGPVLASQAQHARAYQLALLVVGALAIPSIIPVLMMREDWKARDGLEDGLEAAGEGDGDGARAQAGEAAQGGGAGKMARGGGRTAAQVWGTIREVGSGVIGRFSLAQALNGFGAGLFFPFVNLYFVNSLGVSTPYYGALSAALAVVAALASLLAAPLAERYGKRRTAVVAQLLSLPCLLAVGAVPIIAVASVAYLMRGFLMTMTGPPLQTFYMEAVAPERRVLASSVNNVSFQALWALGAGTGGLLVAHAATRAVFFAAAPFYAAGVTLLIVWFLRPGRAQVKG